MSYNPAKRSVPDANGAETEASSLERGSDMVTATVEAHHWTREEYERLVEAGAFEGWKIELVDGVLYDMMAQGPAHSSAVQKLLRELLVLVPGKNLSVRPQMPLAVSDDSLPKPDIAVVPADPDDYARFNPAEAVLVVEVAQSSLHYDRSVKQEVYSHAGIPEYWILNLASWQLEVCRDPAGNRYGSRTVLALADEVSPLFALEASIRIAKLFPQRDT
jgi:Uma2 family endonuclease